MCVCVSLLYFQIYLHYGVWNEFICKIKLYLINGESEIQLVCI